MLMNIVLDIVQDNEIYAVEFPKQMCQSVDGLLNIARAYADQHNINVGDVNIRFAYVELEEYPTLSELVDNYKETN